MQLRLVSTCVFFFKSAPSQQTPRVINHVRYTRPDSVCCVWGAFWFSCTGTELGVHFYRKLINIGAVTGTLLHHTTVSLIILPQQQQTTVFIYPVHAAVTQQQKINCTQFFKVMKRASESGTFLQR